MEVLENSDPYAFDINITSSELGGNKIRLETNYIDIMVGQETSVSGNKELWIKIKTRPAFEVAFLRKNEEAKITVILIRKRRSQSDQLLTKLPGGYQWGDSHDFYSKKIFSDTGISFYASDTHHLGHVIGHSEIKTPIDLYYCTSWEKTGKPGNGIEILEVTLDEAVKMAIDHQLENDSSFTALMRLYYLEKEGLLEFE